MFNPMRIFEQLTEVMDEKASRVLASVLAGVYEDLANTVTKQDFAELKAAVGKLEAAIERLVEAQAKSDERLTRVEAAIERLTQAQAKTDAAIERLTQAQAKTDAAIERLTQAQTKTDAAVERLAEALARLDRSITETRARVDESLRHAEMSQKMQIGALGARWGIQTEEAFRSALRDILAYVGFKVERFEARDDAAAVRRWPSQVELDVVVHNGKTVVVEIKASASGPDIEHFERKVRFFESHSGCRVDRMLVISPQTTARDRETAKRLGIDVCTALDEIEEFRDRL